MEIETEFTKIEIDRLCRVQSNWTKFKYHNQDDYDVRWMLKKIVGFDPDMSPEKFRLKLENRNMKGRAKHNKPNLEYYIILSLMLVFMVAGTVLELKK